MTYEPQAPSDVQTPEIFCARLEIVADDDNAEEAGTVNAFDAGHFDVGSGAGAGDVGSKPRRFLEAREVFGQRLDDVRSVEDTKVEVRQQGDDAATFAGRVVEDNGPGIRDACERGCEDAIAALDFVVGEIVVEFPVDVGSEPIGGTPGNGRDKDAAGAAVAD